MDYVRINNAKILVGGWTISDWGTDYVKISILDENKKEIIDDVKLTRMSRKDLVEVGFVEEKDIECGFTIEFPYEEEKTYYLSIADKKKRKRNRSGKVKRLLEINSCSKGNVHTGKSFSFRRTWTRHLKLQQQMKNHL